MPPAKQAVLVFLDQAADTTGGLAAAPELDQVTNTTKQSIAPGGEVRHMLQQRHHCR